MAPKVKTLKTAKEGNPSTISIDLDHIPLVDSLFQINDCECGFDFYELHSWLKLKYANKEDPIHFWETLFPLYYFPKTHHFHDLITWCQARYDPMQRIVMTKDRKALITITTQSIK